MHSNATHAIHVAEGDVTGTIFASVHDMRRRQEPDIMGGTREGLYARLETRTTRGAAPTVRHMSRLLGEHHWYVDGEFAPNGFPRHNNGFGVRGYLRVDGVRDELDEYLNEQATALGLATALDAKSPLYLSTKDIPRTASAAVPPPRSTTGVHSR